MLWRDNIGLSGCHGHCCHGNTEIVLVPGEPSLQPGRTVAHLVLTWTGRCLGEEEEEGGKEMDQWAETAGHTAPTFTTPSPSVSIFLL